MYGALKRCFTALATQTYAQADMGSTQAKFLRHIGSYGPISQADLARATGTDPGLTGRVLQTLIEREIVRRERSEADRREYVVELTAAGRRAQKRVESLRAELGKKISQTLGDRDVEDFERVVKKLLAAFPPTGGERE